MHWGNGRSWFSRCVSYGPGRQTRNVLPWLTTAYQASESPSNLIYLGREPIVIDRASLLRDRTRGLSLAQLTKA
jgi:hypothetical protein